MLPETRQVLIDKLEAAALSPWDQVLVAAELRKTCTTCRYFGVRNLAETADKSIQPYWCHESPREVSGDDFCSRWAQK